MDDLYARSTEWMDRQLQRLGSLVPSPTEMAKEGNVQYRFVEKTPHQALILKLVRIVSGLRAASVLLDLGFLQEQAALCRMINEFEDDVTFLSLAALQGKSPPILERYLDAFFDEDRTAEDFRSGVRVKGRALVTRKEIINFISTHETAPDNSFQHSNAVLAVSHAFSGYVHGAASHIMEMYDPQSKQFLTKSIVHHPLHADHQGDIWNYYYRGVLAFGFASAAFDDSLCKRSFREFKDFFEQTSRDRGLL